MAWIDTYEFREPLRDLRDDVGAAEALAAELRREVAPGHAFHGKSFRVVARAWSDDDIIVVCDDEVWVVHLTWSGGHERPPWPRVTALGSADDLHAHVAGHDREP